MKKIKKLLVTGCNGFIGRNFLNAIDFNKFKILNLDCLSYASDSTAHLYFRKIKFIKCNTTNYKKLNEIFISFKPDIVINFAAHSHVDKSISDSSLFLQNIVGTQNLLECSLQIQKKKPIKFLQISTDEVFGSKKTGSFNSNSCYNPSSPYSASKASSDFMVKSFNKTYNLPTMITYSCNNYGPFQNPEKLIPLTIFKLLNKKKMGIYGSGQQSRQWIHVKDNVDAIIKLIDKKFDGKTYCIGSNYEINNLGLVKKIVETYFRLINRKYKSYNDHIEFVEDRKGHDFRYFISTNELKKKIIWKQKYSLDYGIEQTVKWYLSNTNWINRQVKKL